MKTREFIVLSVMYAALLLALAVLAPQLNGLTLLVVNLAAITFSVLVVHRGHSRDAAPAKNVALSATAVYLVFGILLNWVVLGPATLAAIDANTQAMTGEVVKSAVTDPVGNVVISTLLCLVAHMFVLRRPQPVTA